MIVRGCHVREEDTTPRRGPAPWRKGLQVCVLSVGLDELTHRQARDRVTVLRVLQRHGRFSAFEASANQSIAKTMDALVASRLIEVEPLGYPWSRVALTEVGQALLGGSP